MRIVEQIRTKVYRYMIRDIFALRRLYFSFSSGLDFLVELEQSCNVTAVILRSTAVDVTCLAGCFCGLTWRWYLYVSWHCSSSWNNCSVCWWLGRVRFAAWVDNVGCCTVTSTRPENVSSGIDNESKSFLYYCVLYLLYFDKVS